MPIPFSLIPVHIKTSIVEKLDIHDFVNFHVSSQKSCIVSVKMKTKFVVQRNLFIGYEGIFISSRIGTDSNKLLDLPVRIVAPKVEVDGWLDDDMCDTMINFFGTTNSSMYYLMVHPNVECTIGRFNRLIDVSKLKQFCCNDIEKEYLTVPNINMLNSVTTVVEYSMGAGLLSSMKMSKMDIDGGADSTGINLILKEWLHGQREIEILDFNGLKIFDYDAIFVDIPHYPLPADDEFLECCEITRPCGDVVYVGYDFHHVRVWS